MKQATAMECLVWTTRISSLLFIGLPIILVGWVIGILWRGIQAGIRMADDTIEWVRDTAE